LILFKEKRAITKDMRPCYHPKLFGEKRRKSEKKKVKKKPHKKNPKDQREKQGIVKRWHNH
jgi:hypothetical protein